MSRSPQWDAWVVRARALPITSVIRARGIKLRRTGNELVGPCPRCGGDDRFGVLISKQLFNCRGCGGKGCGAIDLTMFLDQCEFVDAVRRLNDVGDDESKPITANHTDDADGDAGRIRSAGRLWREAGPIEGTVGISYLERERGIFDLPPDVHDVLRFHRRCVFGKDKQSGEWTFHGCILALYRDIISNEPTGVHRIALDLEGKLIGRRGLGRKQGSAVKLWDDAAVGTGLVVGEGVETCLGAALHVEHKGTLLQPAWSVLDRVNLARFPIISGIEHLTILADADEKGDGQLAARTCAKRWAEAGRHARVLIPDKLGEDFNDIARRRHQQRQAEAIR
jgi:hypothetical protein